MDDRRYILRMNKEQANTMARALDLYTRIGIGQFENILEVYGLNAQTSQTSDGAYYKGYELARTHVDHAKKLLTGYPPNASHGIYSPAVRDEFRVAHDIMQVIRNRLAWDDTPEGGIGVWFHAPHQGSKQSLPNILAEIDGGKLDA